MIDTLFNLKRNHTFYIVNKMNKSIEDILAETSFKNSEIENISIDTMGNFLNNLEMKILDYYQYDNFYSALSSGFEPEALGCTMAPFYFAVQNWSDHLSNFHNKLLLEYDSKLIEHIKENIMDEAGYENGQIYQDKRHTLTFVNFLHALDFKNKIILTKPVINFNNSLQDILDNCSPGFNACVLGGIEFFYIKISSLLLTYCSERNIEQEHYATHEIIDKKHAMDFFTVAQNCNATSNDIFFGVIRGCVLIHNLLDELYKEYCDNQKIEQFVL